ncbi:MAG: type II toxin-antitoxin system prevent-host-death family antitoxin [Limisphaerales bacterium]
MSIRDLRNHGGEVIDRVLGGHDIVITRSGRPVAQILPMRDRGTARTTGLLDTIVVIALARGLDPALLPDESFISTITLAELSDGPLVASTLEGRMARQMVLQHAYADFTGLPFNSEAARRYGQIASALRASGRTVRARAFDTLIAAIARPQDPPVYTANPTDIDLIPDVVVVAVPSPG